MELYLRRMREKDAKELIGWRYDGEYAVYNFSDWDDAVEKGYDITIDMIRRAQWVSVFAAGVLIAFGRLTPLESRMIIGIGLRPDLCGKGLGKKVMRLLIEEARRRAPHAKAALTVRTFNIRARKCYESLGFTAHSSFTSDVNGEPVEYYYMELCEQAQEESV